MMKYAVMQDTTAFTYEEHDVSMKVVLKFLQGDFVPAWCPQLVICQVELSKP